MKKWSSFRDAAARKGAFPAVGLVLGLMVLGLVVLGGCAATVASVKENPGRYAGQVVQLRGEAVRAVTIPMTEMSIFQLDDGTGSIIVVSPLDRKKGEQVKVEASVVGFDGTSESSVQAVEKIRQFLVDQEIVAKALAGKVAEKAVDVINGMSETAEGAYFLIEKGK